jgi:MFS family permease
MRHRLPEIVSPFGCAAALRRPSHRPPSPGGRLALGIVAYRDGGATAVGLVGLLRMVPSAVVAPLATPLADRGRRERVLVLVSSIRGVAIGPAGIVLAVDGSVLIVYVLAALATVAGTLYRPAHSALLPSLCRTGQELTSANVVRGMLDSVATLAGPSLALF